MNVHHHGRRTPHGSHDGVSAKVTGVRPSPLPMARLLNGAFHAVSNSQAVDFLADCLAKDTRGWVSTVNVSILMAMRRDPWLQDYVDESLLTVADGQPLVWATRRAGTSLPERIAGIDLIDSLCARAEEQGASVYLLGAHADVVEGAARYVRTRNPGLIVHTADGYFTADEEPTRVRAIAESGARVLFVGMGVPRQEAFIQRNWESLGVTLAVGVGGSFDVLAGLRRRAPNWMQRSGLEWAYRLRQEPRRLFWRYASTNTEFVFQVLRSRTSHR